MTYQFWKPTQEKITLSLCVPIAWLLFSVLKKLPFLMQTPEVGRLLVFGQWGLPELRSFLYLSFAAAVLVTYPVACYIMTIQKRSSAHQHYIAILLLLVVHPTVIRWILYLLATMF